MIHKIQCLPPCEIHLWFCQRPYRINPALAELTTPSEQQRVANIASASRRIEWLTGRVLLRQCLAHYLDQNALEISVVKSEQGKPRLHNPPIFADFDFSLSHGPRWIGCAVARANRVGLDIDSNARRTRCKDIAARYFHPHERQALANCMDETTRQRLFFSLWTLKESFTKACGLTVNGRRLHDTAFDLSNKTAPRPLFPLTEPHWQFRHTRFLGDQHLALASLWPDNKPVRIRYWLWQPGAQPVELAAGITSSFIDQQTGEPCVFQQD